MEASLAKLPWVNTKQYKTRISQHGRAGIWLWVKGPIDTPACSHQRPNSSSCWDVHAIQSPVLGIVGYDPNSHSLPPQDEKNMGVQFIQLLVLSMKCMQSQTERKFSCDLWHQEDFGEDGISMLWWHFVLGGCEDARRRVFHESVYVVAHPD